MHRRTGNTQKSIMKKTILLILIALISGTVFAQKKYDVKEAEEVAKIDALCKK